MCCWEHILTRKKCGYSTNTVCVASQSTSCHVPKWQLFIFCTHEWSRAAANSCSIQTHKVVDFLQSFNAERVAWEVCPIQTIEEKLKQRLVKGKWAAILNILIQLHSKLKLKAAQRKCMGVCHGEKTRIVSELYRERDTHTHTREYPISIWQWKSSTDKNPSAGPYGCWATYEQRSATSLCSPPWVYLQKCLNDSQSPSRRNFDLTSALNLFWI